MSLRPRIRRDPAAFGVALALAAILTTAALASPAAGAVTFDRFFTGKALRFDLYQVGDAKDEMVTIDRIMEEPLWTESRASLLDPFDNGRYTVKLYDIASNALIYSRGFDGMFGEYKTTTPAIDGVKRVFQRSVRVPEPKRPAVFAVEVRDKRNLPRPLFTVTVDPSDYHIVRETATAGDVIYEARATGDPRERADLVFVGEGYTAADQAKFRADVDRFMNRLFEVEPYAGAKDRFNVRGVLRPSPEGQMDEPRQKAFRKTALDASFNAFDLDRYMLIEENHRLREIAAQVPYDAIVVLVNSKRYGGGGIYGDYCVTTVDHPRSLEVFLHEFGHSFAGLADEYYASEVSYNDFYPKGVEPLEPNITALLDPANVKWADLLAPGIAVPTPYGKEEMEAIQQERRKAMEPLMKEMEAARAGGAAPEAVAKLEAAMRKAGEPFRKKIEEIRKRFAGLEDKVGVFEGAGYASKGLYRPQMGCIMISGAKFCAVCRRAIARMIDYYARQS